jgi:signal transduction histidine kinase/DNA-binding response OmpR family regulator
MEARILIVAERTAPIETLIDILSDHGYEVEACADGETGWVCLVTGAEQRAPLPDLLILDLSIPEVDGLDLLRRIRADEQFALLPVIALTIEPDVETRLTVLEAGANDYLLKPVQPLELLARVKTLTARRLAERLQQRRMEHLVEAGSILLSTLDLDRVLERVMEITMIEMDTEDASIWLQKPDGSLECRAAFGKAAQHLVGVQMDPGRGIAGWAMLHNQSVLVPDAQADSRFNPDVDAKLGFHTRDLVTVPLSVRGTSIGVLQTVNKKRGIFSPADMAWMEVLAPLAAAAISSAQFFQELQQSTVELQERAIQLQAHNEELDAFAHTVAHDLKSPVTTIVGYASMLEETYDELPDELLHEILSEVAQGANKISRIIDELLLLAGARKKHVTMEPLEMGIVVHEALDRLAGMIEESQAEIILPETWPEALGHGPWVEEVWANYISNAIKYGGQPPQVELGADHALVSPESAGETEREYVRFWVRDNGPGISPEAQTRLFVPFTQLDQVRGKGHGLGLSIVQRIVERLGGQVSVDSEIGQGSLFAFSLPRLDD